MTRDLESGRPIRTAAGVDAGISRRTLAGADYRQLHRGCYVRSERADDLATRVQAALEMVPGAYGLSHHTAAEWYGATVPHTPDIHLAIPHRLRCELPGIRAHRYRERPHLWNRRGIPLTSPTQTFTDMAAFSVLVDQVVLADALVRRSGISQTDLVDAARQSHSRGVNLARRAAQLARPGVDSSMETRSRLLLDLGGLPEPSVNVPIFDASGDLVRRLDMAYRAQLLAVEYDGRHHIAREAQWAADLERREALEGAGWRFIVLISADIWATPGATLDRVRAALVERGAPAPGRLTEWRRHFPERPTA